MAVYDFDGRFECIAMNRYAPICAGKCHHMFKKCLRSSVKWKLLVFASLLVPRVLPSFVWTPSPERHFQKRRNGASLPAPDPARSRRKHSQLLACVDMFQGQAGERVRARRRPLCFCVAIARLVEILGQAKQESQLFGN